MKMPSKPYKAFKVISFIFLFFVFCLPGGIFGRAGSLFLVYADDEAIAPQVSYTAKEYLSPFKLALPEKIEQAQPIYPVLDNIEAPPVFELQGIVWGGRYPQAIINNSVVKAGGRIGGAEVLAINKDKVELLYQDKVIIISSQEAEKSEEQRRGNENYRKDE